MAKNLPSVALIVGGVIMAPTALFVSALSAGAGHGSYIAARLLFPYTMLATRLFENRLAPLLIVSAILQFPLYGLVAGLMPDRRARWIALVVLGVSHIVAVGAAFSGALPSYS